jgi:hypothetical protein
MSDWKYGDLALCVSKGKFNSKDSIETGKIYVVDSFMTCFSINKDNHNIAVLHLKDGPHNIIGTYGDGHLMRIWPEKCFIKVSPQAEDKFDRDIIDAYRGRNNITVTVKYNTDKTGFTFFDPSRFKNL